MTERVLQLNYRVKSSGKDYQAAVSPLADAFAAVPGLRWKLWYQKNETSNEAGAIYLFENQASLDKFLASDLAAKVTGHSALSDVSIKQFDMLEKESMKTRAPVGEKVAV